MDEAHPDDPSTRRRITQLRAQVRLAGARPNDGRCGRVAEALRVEFGWRRHCGFLLLLDGMVSWIHCWNVLDDGTVVDATADQFQDLWIGDALTIGPASSLQSHYLLRPPELELRVECGRRPTLGWAVGDQGYELAADGSERPWTTLAARFLRELTGWVVHDRVVELSARILRAAGATGRPITSTELIHPLIIQSVQHLGRRSEPAWVAPEFREPV